MSFLKDLLKSIVSSEVKKEVRKEAGKVIGSDPWKQTGQSAARPVSSHPEGMTPPPPSGESWGPVMPNEPNQFNSGLSYIDYFASVFAEAFPEYRIECERWPRGSNSVVFTFWQGEWKALIVEVLPQSSDVQKLRRDCRRTGLPYLRFYHNHPGWWNTKAYVINRVSAALRR